MRYAVICFLVVCYVIRAPGATVMRRQERLAGGSRVTDHRYPWVVAIRSSYAKNLSQNEVINRICTGSIIDIYGTVITAAHCVEDPKEIASETYRLQKVAVKWGCYVCADNNRGIILPPNTVSRHPGSYSEHRKTDRPDIDFAVIRLTNFVQNPINCSDPTVMPIELSTRSRFSTPTNGMVAGFGSQPKTNQNNVITGYIRGGWLSELPFRFGGRGLMTRNESRRYVKGIDASAIFFGFPNLTSGDKPYSPTTGKYYTGGCKGDSGGPFMENEDGKIRLRGVVMATPSHNDTSPCGEDGQPDIFADINYPLIRNWTNWVLAARYNQTGVGLLGGIPRVCP